jgi:hypothetical protein
MKFPKAADYHKSNAYWGFHVIPIANIICSIICLSALISVPKTVEKSQRKELGKNILPSEFMISKKTSGPAGVSNSCRTFSTICTARFSSRIPKSLMEFVRLMILWE